MYLKLSPALDMFEWGNFSLRECSLAVVAQAPEVWEGEHCSLLKAVSSASAGYFKHWCNWLWMLSLHTVLCCIPSIVKNALSASFGGQGGESKTIFLLSVWISALWIQINSFSVLRYSQATAVYRINDSLGCDLCGIYPLSDHFAWTCGREEDVLLEYQVLRSKLFEGNL